MYIYIYIYIRIIHFRFPFDQFNCDSLCTLYMRLQSPRRACNALTRYNTLQHAFTAMQLFVSQVVLCVSYGAKHARGPSFRLQWTSTSTMQAAWTNLPSLLSSIFSQKNQWPLELRRHSTLPLCVRRDDFTSDQVAESARGISSRQQRAWVHRECSNFAECGGTQMNEKQSDILLPCLVKSQVLFFSCLVGFVTCFCPNPFHIR